MKSKVYFISVNNPDSIPLVQEKLKRLLKESNFLGFVPEHGRLAIKIHFGEEGNTGYVKPEYVKVVSSELKKRGVDFFLSDTNTLYKGKRLNSKDHLELAYAHGFIREKCGSKVVIPQDSKKNTAEVKVDGKFVKTAKVSRIFTEQDAILGIAHFKGHIMTGFGGALKNIGMGCAAREGKLFQHSQISPYVVSSKCISCKKCIESCPVDTIILKDKKAYIESSGCIGCATCIAVCPVIAIDVPWESGGDTIQKKMAEYAWAVLKEKKNRSGFINFLTKITRECDCLAKDDPRIVPDIGILVSHDPVSIDQASFDMVKERAGYDIFKELHPLRDGFKQLKHAEEAGLGSREYELIAVT
ncbi:MAG TPA: DUF362 domain-containing protein [Candidatus Margulisiibacteriota bacterium]|nr:DUF362 domain-containing protein [Candidatus Margulisiibacteriota bacterium]